MKCLLEVLVHKEHYFTLAMLNERISSFPYGSDVTDHPKPIPSGFSTSVSANGIKQCGKLIIVYLDHFIHYAFTSTCPILQ